MSKLEKYLNNYLDKINTLSDTLNTCSKEQLFIYLNALNIASEKLNVAVESENSYKDRLVEYIQVLSQDNFIISRIRKKFYDNELISLEQRLLKLNFVIRKTGFYIIKINNLIQNRNYASE